MPHFTVDELETIMSRCTGGDDVYRLGESELDTTFPDLSFDSLAVLELATRIQQDYRMPFPDEAVERMKTPRDVLHYVNDRLAVA